MPADYELAGPELCGFTMSGQPCGLPLEHEIHQAKEQIFFHLFQGVTKQISDELLVQYA